ncbi:MAG: hypothetical protein HY342_00695 [Candidatus Lambdaproteobacteria bacterium]|nr:hypothetical protein [Candidatus Lambdaproteobacteria bacterium]
MAMKIDTYFGFFATSVFTAMAGTLGEVLRRQVSLEHMALAVTNTLKLRWSDIDTVLLPTVSHPGDVSYVFALSERDLKSLAALAEGRVSMQRLMEAAVGTAVEPFNFITKKRAKLTALQFSKNVTGLTAAHLQGQVAYTMAVGEFRALPSTQFTLRLLVTSRGRDVIEARTTEKGPQRALFSINEGAYVCRPQWEPPPPPPGAERGEGLAAVHMNGWLNSFFLRNCGSLAPKLFRQPAAMTTEIGDVALLKEAAQQPRPPTVVRLQLNEQKAMEAFLVVAPDSAQTLLQLSKSGQERFVGDLLRTLFGDAGGLWEGFGGTPLRWKLLATRKFPPDAMSMIEERVQGGVVARQTVALDEGRLSWLLALGGHTWQWLMRLTARALDLPLEGMPERKAIFRATGWGDGGMAWGRLIQLTGERELQELVRLLGRAEMSEQHFATVAMTLERAAREAWFAAMPVGLRERTHACKLDTRDAPALHAALSNAMVGLAQSGRMPDGKTAAWVSVYSEIHWAHRRNLIEQLLPVRHLVYGMDRASLSRLLFDTSDKVLVPLMCGASFPVIDQMRRAISPGFAMRLLEDVQELRPRTNAFEVQEAQLALYRRCSAGVTAGRYMLRATPSRRLGELLRWLDETAS